MEFQHFSAEMCEIEHPLHPQHRLSLLCQVEWIHKYVCYACGQHAKGFCFRCSTCKFTLDDQCYLLTPTKTLDDGRISDLHNQDSLILCNVDMTFCRSHYVPKKFTRSCHACRQLIDHKGSIYVSVQRNYLLHKSCGELPPEKLHPFHQHPLRLVKGQSHFGCHACGRNEGYFFTCSDCKFELDIVCANSLTLANEDFDEQGQISHRLAGHSHSLIMCHAITSHNFGRSCSLCTLPFDDDEGSVIYVCLECKILLHKSCTELAPKIKHPFHQQHPLTLLYRQQNKSTDCKACGDAYFGGTYDCLVDGCKFTMHAKCASVVPKIWSERHEHPLAFFNTGQPGSVCKACQAFITERTSYFRCVDCNFNLHLHCNSRLPKTVNNEYHLHPLTFTNGKAPVKLLKKRRPMQKKDPIKVSADNINSAVRGSRTEDEDAKVDCDCCETRRNLFDSTYNCDECSFAAHFECVLDEVVRLQEEKNPEEKKMYTWAEVIEDNITDEVLPSTNVLEMEGTEQQKNSDVYYLGEVDKEMKIIREEVEARLTKLKPLKTKLAALELKRSAKLYEIQYSQDNVIKLDESIETKATE